MNNFRLREAVDSDRLMVLGWRNHPEVRRVMLTTDVISVQQHNTWWAKVLSGDDRRLLIVENDNQPVAVITIYNYDHKSGVAWWGFYIDNSREHTVEERLTLWLKTEELTIDYAATTLKVQKLRCESLSSNLSVIAIHEKFGFEKFDVLDGSRETEEDVTYMEKKIMEDAPEARGKVLFYSSYNTDFLAASLNNTLNDYPFLGLEANKVPFGQYKSDVMGLSSGESSIDAKIVVFCERVEDLVGGFYEVMSPDLDFALLEARVEEYMELISLVRHSQPKIELYVFDFSLHKPFPLSMNERLMGGALDRKLLNLNNKLYKFCEENDVGIISYSQLLKCFGSEASYSAKYWYMARCPFDSSFMTYLVKNIVGAMLSNKALGARVLVLDLDNTLWGGVVGDDGANSLQIGGDYPGNIYRDLQALFKSLSKRGFLLAVCSKNTESVALDAINKHPQMLIRESDLVAKRINWNSKADNIASMADELNLGLGSFCFIDDNPMERAEVRRRLPDVYIPELPEDPSEWYGFIASLPELMLKSISESDKRRADLYKQRSTVKKLEASYTDRRSFLESLEILVSISQVDEYSFARAHQLITKTNQFNTTTERYSESELQNMCKSASHMVLSVSSKDKFTSDLEGIACLVVKIDSCVMEIKNFVMSCRVMGRDIEKVILDELAQVAKKMGCTSLVGCFIATDRNMPVSDLYADNGFEKLNDEKWVRSLSGFSKGNYGIKVLCEIVEVYDV